MNGSATLEVAKKAALSIGFEDAYARFKAKEDKGKGKIILVEEDKEAGLEETSIPYLEARASLGAKRTSFSVALKDGEEEGDSLSVSFANREVSAYLDGETAYLDLSDFNTFAQAADFLDVDLSFLSAYWAELELLLFGEGITTSIEPVYGQIAPSVVSLYDGYLSIKNALLESDPLVFEMALGFLTEYIKCYQQGEVYSIEIPGTYKNLSTVFEIASSFGLLGETFEPNYDFEGMFKKLLPGLDEKTTKISLSFTEDEILGLDAYLKTGLDISPLLGLEEVWVTPNVDLWLHLGFEEVTSIDYPDFSRYLPICASN